MTKKPRNQDHPDTERMKLATETPESSALDSFDEGDETVGEWQSRKEKQAIDAIAKHADGTQMEVGLDYGTKFVLTHPGREPLVIGQLPRSSTGQERIDLTDEEIDAWFAIRPPAEPPKDMPATAVEPLVVATDAEVAATGATVVAARFDLVGSEIAAAAVLVDGDEEARKALIGVTLCVVVKPGGDLRVGVSMHPNAGHARGEAFNDALRQFGEN